jgi:hypothetical protein
MRLIAAFIDRVALIDWEPYSAHSMAFVYVVRTDFGRPSSSMRFKALTAIAISVARRRSVRERSASPITRLNRLMDASTRAR